MIVIDTNVVSAVMRDLAEARVIAWMNALPASSLWISAISIFEIRFGLARLPAGKRRQTLENAFERSVAEDFEGRVLNFDEGAANAAGAIAAAREAVGKPVEVRDIQIAGIAKHHGATVATRNTRHFEGLGITLIDPWTASR